ncbi:TonB-dependent receptor [Pontibacter sp. G13]|uniref:TonB-dependent receptor n=1 Tax=Pontibacter sp. G13 TaxID=3074898 RepID=UPI00288B923A|nr:TonB-dependent receptor [Pontibacter sp. G13]WNJ19990.1 TonB-dependent receptor [Pontibacter sp. G13]
MRNAHTLLLSFLLLIAGFDGFAQTNGPAPGENRSTSIAGQVVDASTDNPLELATVTILHSETQKPVAGGLTQADGRFAIDVQPGTWNVRIEFISFEAQTMTDISVERGEQVDLGKISLKAGSVTLDEVEVTAQKSQVIMALDKKVFNVGQDMTVMGGTASDILDNIPSVTVDIDGNVALRGSQNVRILIDGKPSGLAGISSTEALRQLQGNMIERIEVVTNPSARYDAEGLSGIINIVLKKEKRKGLNGSFDVNTGVPHNHGAAVNMNFRRKKINLFATTGFRYRRRPGYNNDYQIFTLPDTSYITDRKRDFNRGGYSGNLRFGADWYLNDKNVITTSFLYRYGKDDNHTITRYRDMTINEDLIQLILRTDDELETEQTLEYALNYKKTFDQEGRTWTIDVQYQQNTETEGSDFQEGEGDDQDNFFENAPMLFQRSNNSESENRLLIQSDYIHPIGKAGKFEIGTRNTLRNIQNNYLVEQDPDGLGNWESLLALSNDFSYQENIFAAYAIYGNKLKRFSYQFGLRTELSDIVTELKDTEEVNARTYANLFPSGFLNYEFGGMNTVQLSYSRRLRRPGFWELNPFLTFSDARNIFAGNPNLDPEFTHSTEVSHMKYWDNFNISSALYWRHTQGVISRLIETDQNGISSYRPYNLDTRDAFGVEFTYSGDLTKWWKLNGSFNFYRSITRGGDIDPAFQNDSTTLSIENEDLFADTYSWTTRLNSRFVVSKQVQIQLTGNYRAPEETTQGRQKARYFVDLGASAEILKNKATLTLSVRDVFNTRGYYYVRQTDLIQSEGVYRRAGSQFQLAFNYRLNQKKKRGRPSGGYQGGGGDMGGF